MALTLTEKFARALDPGISPRRTWLVGVSGGRDSVVLLHLLHALGFRKLVVCHLNHKLRGREATGDARFTSKLAREMGYAFAGDSADVKRLAKTGGISLETAARHARHEFFLACARQHKCWNLLLAHHADDQVETVIHHLFRGTGPQGLGGIKAESSLKLPGQKKELKLIRPMLGIWREEIAQHVLEEGIAFREDASNAAQEFTRNRIRHVLIPMLEKVFGRDVRGAVWRLAEICQAEDALLEETAASFPLRHQLDAKALRCEPIALQRRILRRWLKAEGAGGIGYHEVEAVRALLDPVSPAGCNLPANKLVRRSQGKIFLRD